MTTLAEFFATMKPFLQRQIDARAVTDRLGPRASDRDGLRFYATLMQRNEDKTMRELFPALCIAIDRARPGAWAAVVRHFRSRHPARGHHPDRLGDGFEAYLQARHDAGEDIPIWWIELADLHRLQLLAATAPDDGFERTIFVRRYTHAIPKVAAAPHDGAPPPVPTTVVVYRDRHDGRVRLLFPSVVELAVLARRAGAALPDAFVAIPGSALATAEHRLVRAGVLPPITPLETP